ncbi:penicillin acylase family protein [Temperatibacter marinus]|uniref:Penicillin acylase family protein n=1 Tax=Temperatibacter marinus TaxID=1456591 RepID=A0AA52EG29_9PROT|nr:penicillin acylase family protein [Temperatibacter marinus]WND02478.1 penicillin acylase family protein [Temperatibacter marinus]
MRKSLKWVIGLVLVFGLTAITSILILRSSLPTLSGQVHVTGISGSVTIARDENGVPHISAAEWKDLYFGVGYVHAQDRLWQLEMNRRIGSGRLAEAVGEAGLRTDRYFRTLGFRDRAEKAYANMSLEEKATLQAYADGINAYLTTRTGVLPPEFLILGVDPEPWTPVDSLVWGKMMWLSLSTNYRRELARAQLMTKLSPEQVAHLYPTYPGEFEHPLPDMKDYLKDLPLDALASAVGEEKPNGFGSNNWVISGDLTKSGKPLLANDPHLGLTTPSIWYLVRLHHLNENKNIVGVSFPGNPGVVLGRNDQIAWGFTNTATDVQDLFIEKLMEDQNYYLTPDGPKRFIERQEIIKVKDGDDVRLTVRETRHGPVLTDLLDRERSITPEGHVLALQWTALGDKDSQVEALAGMMKAETFEQVKESAKLYMGPQQNMVYADTEGNIGYYSPSTIPVRHEDNHINGRLPSPGWLAVYDWQGYLPLSEVPERYNVESGIIATANEKIVEHDYPHYLTRDWSMPYRGNRIRNELSQRKDHDIETMKALHLDTVSDVSKDLSPLFPAKNDRYPQLLKALKDWNGDFDKERAEPLIFDHWMRLYSKALMADELGEELYNKTLRKRPYFLKNVWAAEARTPAHPQDPYYALPPIDDESLAKWCDNVQTTDQRETCAQLSEKAFDDAMDGLIKAHGEDWNSWRWGDAHILTQTHRPFGEVKAIAEYFQLTSEQAGSTFTINVAGNSWREKSLNKSSFGASYRGIFDLANMDDSLFITTTGQSGNPLSKHFGDMLPLWSAGNYIKIPTAQVIPIGSDVLVLKKE